MLPLVILGALWVACIAVFLYTIFVAPRGYQDKTGFHYGEEPLTDERIDRPLRRPRPRRAATRVDTPVPAAH